MNNFAQFNYQNIRKSFHTLCLYISNQQSAKFLPFCFTLFVILAFRNPDTLLNAQFWAEDGGVFFADAYNKGFFSLIQPYEGYVLIFQRFLALVTVQTQFFNYIPLIWNLISLAVISVIIFVFSSEIYAKVIPEQKLRLILALVIATGGLYGELLVNLTNLQWFISLIGLHFVIYIYSYSNKALNRSLAFYFFLAVLFLVPLSAPQAVIFIPALAFLFIKKRISSTNKLYVLAFVFGAVCQFIVYIISHKSGVDPNISYHTLEGLVRIHYYHSIVLNFIPNTALNYLLNSGWKTLVHMIGLISLLTYLFVSRRSKILLFALFLIALSNFVIVSVGRNDMVEYISILLKMDNSHATRYFVIYYVLLILLGFHALSVTKFKNMFVIAVISIQIITAILLSNYQLIYTDLDWAKDSSQIRNLKEGQTLTIPINPVNSDNWRIELKK